jgi:hypothetical protein
MIVDKIIELELKFLKECRIPTKILMNLSTFNVLILELEVDRYFNCLHNMQIEIINSKSGQLIVI